MGKLLPRAETDIFLGVWLFLLWLGQAQFLSDPGIFWSTVLGRHMLATGQVPHAEEFSCTLHGQPWNSHQWLAQVVMAALERLAGLDALVLAAATLLAVLYTWVAWRLIRAGLHWSIAALVVALTVLASRYHLHARPHLASIVLLGWTFARLADYEAGRISLRRLFWLPPAFVLWSNLHGGALGGLASVFLVTVGWCLAWPLGLKTPVQRPGQAAGLLALLGLCGLATLVNPYGIRLPQDWLRLMGSPVVPKYIYEHMPLDPFNPFQLPIVLFGAVYVAALLSLPSWNALRLSWLLPVVWLLLTVQRVRHCTLFSITAAVALADLLPRTRLAVWLAAEASWLYRPPDEQKPAAAFPWAAALLPALAVLGAASLQLAGEPVPLLGKDIVQSVRLWPMALLPPLQEYERDHPEAPIFNDMAYGGFLIYYTPQLRVFVDDRCELYGDAFLEDYFETNAAFLKAKHERKAGPAEIAQMEDPIARWERQYGIKLDIALVLKESGFYYYLDSVPERWTKIGDTSSADFPYGAVLYRRRPTLGERGPSAP